MRYPRIPKEGIFVTNHGNVTYEEFLLILAFGAKDNELRKELLEAVKNPYEESWGYKKNKYY